MKIIIIGATGTIGSEVVKALLLNKHEVVGASRNGEVKINLDDPAASQSHFTLRRDRVARPSAASAVLSARLDCGIAAISAASSISPGAGPPVCEGRLHGPYDRDGPAGVPPF
jgi:nucleoside-diphosphate-sugar epimerase